MTRSRQKKSRTAVRRQHQRMSMRRSAKKSALSHLQKRDRCKRQRSTYTRKTSIRKKQSRIQKRTQQQRKRKSRLSRRCGGQKDGDGDIVDTRKNTDPLKHRVMERPRLMSPRRPPRSPRTRTVQSPLPDAAPAPAPATPVAGAGAAGTAAASAAPQPQQKQANQKSSSGSDHTEEKREQPQQKQANQKWRKIFDNMSSRDYFYDTTTGESTWDQPEDYIEESSSSTTAAPQPQQEQTNQNREPKSLSSEVYLSGRINYATMRNEQQKQMEVAARNEQQKQMEVAARQDSPWICFRRGDETIYYNLNTNEWMENEPKTGYDNMWDKLYMYTNYGLYSFFYNRTTHAISNFIKVCNIYDDFVKYINQQEQVAPAAIAAGEAEASAVLEKGGDEVMAGQAKALAIACHKLSTNEYINALMGTRQESKSAKIIEEQYNRLQSELEAQEKKAKWITLVDFSNERSYMDATNKHIQTNKPANYEHPTWRRSFQKIDTESSKLSHMFVLHDTCQTQRIPIIRKETKDSYKDDIVNEENDSKNKRNEVITDANDWSMPIKDKEGVGEEGTGGSANADTAEGTRGDSDPAVLASPRSSSSRPSPPPFPAPAAPGPAAPVPAPDPAAAPAHPKQQEQQQEQEEMAPPPPPPPTGWENLNEQMQEQQDQEQQDQEQNREPKSPSSEEQQQQMASSHSTAAAPAAQISPKEQSQSDQLPLLPPQNASDRLPLQKTRSAPELRELRRKSSFHTRRKMRTHLSASGYKKWG